MDQDVATQLLAQMAELQAAVDGPSTGWFTIGAAAIGFLAAMGSTVLVEHLRKKHETQTLLSSLVAEMSAMAEIIRARGYIEALREGASGQRDCLSVNVPNDYFIVYKSNTARLGLLKRQEASRIVYLYHLVESVVQDVIPGGTLYTGEAGQEGFRQDAEFLERALQIADELVAEHGSEHRRSKKSN